MAGEVLGGLLGGGGGSVVGGAVVRLFLDDRQFGTALAKAEGQTKGASTGMSAGFAKLKAVGQAALIALGVAAVKFAADSVRSFEESEEVLQKLRIAFGDNTAALEADAAALQLWSGFSDEAILSADTVYARLGLTEDQIRSLIPLTLDYARATGQDVPASAQSMAKALLGSTRALKAVGIASTDFVVTGDRAKDLAKLMELLQGKIGGTAKAVSGNLDVKLAVLNNQIDEVKEKVGEALVPALGDLVDAAGELVTKGAPLIEAFFGVVAASLQEAADLASEVVDGLSSIADELPFLGDKADEGVGSLSSFNKAMLFTKLGLHSLLHPFSGFSFTVGEAASNTDKLTGAQNDYNAVGEESVQILKDQKDAEDALAGGLLGLITSLKTVAADQQALNHLRQHGKTDTKEYRDAQLQLLQDQLSFEGSLDDMISKMKDAGASSDEVKDKIVKLGHEVGISKADVLALANDALDTLNSKARGAADGVNSAADAIDRLHDKKVNIDIITHYTHTGKLD